MTRFKVQPLTLQTRWNDLKGREWRIVEKLPFGRNVCTTTDLRYQGDWSSRDIRNAIDPTGAPTSAQASPPSDQGAQGEPTP